MSPGTATQFRDEVIAATPGGERLSECIQCGTCGGSCPNGADMQYTPRQIFALINADIREDVLTSNTLWMCVSCYLCTSRCPQGIPITDIMYTLKREAIKQGYARDTDAPALARAFTNLVHKYGRSFELGLASRYYLTRKPGSLLRSAPMGLSMFRRGRLALRPRRIKNIEELRTIIDTAKKLGGAS